MNSSTPIDLDVVIFGGGVAGLWLLDDLTRAGHAAVLLETSALGSGQTVASQGILHGGLKYTLSNLIDPGARAVAKMPLIWRDCLAGKTEPDLSHTRMRAQFCYLWQTGDTSSRLGMTGARAALRVKPIEVSQADWPDVLQPKATAVYRLDEQVICPQSFVSALAVRNTNHLVRIDKNELTFEHDAGQVRSIRLSDCNVELRPRHVVLTAGEGNAAIREQLGLTSVMQRRPLHMVMLRGKLPELNGHCTDFSKTRLTITTDQDDEGRIVWQIGGQVSEDGVSMDAPELIRHTRQEVQDILPELDLTGCQWAAYHVDRAEHVTRGGLRPGSVSLVEDANVLTAWPTKLVLAPQLASDVLEKLPKPTVGVANLALPDLPRPDVAKPPWETATTWINDH